MLGKVFKAYDVRATYPKPLNEKMAWQIGYAIAQYLTAQSSEAGRDDPMMRYIAVGHDMRRSSPALAKALKQGIRDFGANVIDVGLVDTPFVSFAINHLGCSGGVQVTASHNPANYNGFKVSKMGARPVGMTTGLDEIRRYAAMVDRMDRGVGAIVAELERTGRLDDTLILFLQDNGGCAEVMGRKGEDAHPDIPRPPAPTLAPLTIMQRLPIRQSSPIITGAACAGSSTPPMPTPPDRCTLAPIWAQEPTVAHVSTIEPAPTRAPMFT